MSLSGAIDYKNGGMSLIPFFQPVCDVWAHKVIGYEATIRGAHREPALELFADALLKGTVVDFDQQAREIAVKQGMRFLQPEEKLFLNICPQSLTEKREWIPQGIPKEQVVLEITEQMPIPMFDQAKTALLELVRQGVSLALDDYGRGFHNMRIVAELPIHYVKLDRSLVSCLEEPKTRELVKMLARFCQDNRIQFVAEGVETLEQKELLLDLGVRYMQGYFFGYPKLAVEYLKAQSPLVF